MSREFPATPARQSQPEISLSRFSCDLVFVQSRRSRPLPFMAEALHCHETSQITSQTLVIIIVSIVVVTFIVITIASKRTRFQYCFRHHTFGGGIGVRSKDCPLSGTSTQLRRTSAHDHHFFPGIIGCSCCSTWFRSTLISHQIGTWFRDCFGLCIPPKSLELVLPAKRPVQRTQPRLV